MHRSLVVSSLRRAEPGRDQCHRIVSIGALSLNLDLQQASVAGQPIMLSPAEFSVIRLLASRPNVPMTKDAILAALEFGPMHCDRRMVDVYVNRARRALDASGLPGILTTVCGRGYAILKMPGSDERVPTVRHGLDPVLVAA